MFRLQNSDIKTTSEQLDIALHDHRVWVSDLMRSLVCNTAHDNTDKQTDAHQHCGFGRWYYGKHPDALIHNKTFQTLEANHKKMHRQAGQMLDAIDRGITVSTTLFDNFYIELDTFITLVESLKGQLDKLLYSKDPLTGAFNRLSLMEELYTVKEMIYNPVNTACLVMMDIDHFKHINDTYGHSTGDEVLKELAGRVRPLLRSHDKFFRFGGEEFLITLVNADIETAVRIAERIRKAISAVPVEGRLHRVSVTASFGIAIINSNSEIDECIECVDHALYEAKNKGRNCIEIYAPR